MYSALPGVKITASAHYKKDKVIEDNNYAEGMYFSIFTHDRDGPAVNSVGARWTGPGLGFQWGV